MDNQTIFNIILSTLVVVLIILLTLVLTSESGKYCEQWNLSEGLVSRNNIDSITGPLKDEKNNTYIFHLNDDKLNEVIYNSDYQIIKNDTIDCYLYLKVAK